MEGKAITGGGKVGKQGKFQWGSAGNVLWEELNMRDLAYLRLLAREYPNVQAASSEIINLMAIRGLPKGTEYFSVTCMGNTRPLSISFGARPVSSGKRSPRPLAM